MDDKWALAKRRTSDLYDVISKVDEAHPDLDSWIRNYLEVFGIRRADVVRRSYLNPTFAYQIISGVRKGSRDKLIQISRGMQLDIEHTDELLERGGFSALRPYVIRDVVIAFCIARNMDVPAIDDMLTRVGEQPLMKSSAAYDGRDDQEDLQGW